MFFPMNCPFRSSCQSASRKSPYSIHLLAVWLIPNGCLIQISEQQTELLLLEEVGLNSQDHWVAEEKITYSELHSLE